MAKEYLKKAGLFIYRYKFTVLSMLYVGLIAFLPIKFAFSVPMLLHAASFFFLLNILAKTRYTFALTFVLSFVLAFNAYFSFVLGTDIPLEVMASIFETHDAEAVSMMRKIWLPAIVALAATTALLVLAEKELKASSFSRKYSVIALLAYLLLFIPIVSYKRIAYEYQEELFREFPIRVTQDKLNMYAPILYGNIATIVAYQEEMSLLRQFAGRTDKKLPEGIVYNDTVQAPQKIYLVIGESAYRKHLSLYGYPVKTTPFLDSLSQVEPPELKYYDGIAAAAFTRNVLRIVLSFASPRNMAPFYEEKTLIDLANDAGYDTYWISNQGAAGIEDSYLGYLAAGTQTAIFTQGGYLANDDLDLIPLLKDMHKDEGKQFFVIHLVGSHNNYSDRYDKTDAEAIPGNKSLVNEYDRSIHHTDRVLRKIYNVMQQDSTAVFFYFSDHGEILGKGHGPWKNGRAQFDIPLLTINRHAPQIDTVMEKYLDPKTGLVNNSSTIYVLAEIMGYFIPPKYVDQSIEDGRYVRHADRSHSLYADVKEKPE
jgi:glucan phosphoethanolaminetransferase (alkaline phosphatase superfamily)